LARGADAKAADKVAMKLGTQFAHDCVQGVPGGGFCMPSSSKKGEIKAAAPQPAKFAPQPLQSQPVVQAAPPQPTRQAQQSPANMMDIAMPVIAHTVPTIENVENIDPKTVHDLLRRRKCLLVDLRDQDREAGLIEGAIHESAFGDEPFPVKVNKLVQRWSGEQMVIFTCQYSAHRAPQCANWYREKANPHQRVGILAGGFRGWEALGLPVQHLATGEAAQKADEVAVCLGAKFTASCIAGVPGGGFVMPS